MTTTARARSTKQKVRTPSRHRSTHLPTQRSMRSHRRCPATLMFVGAHPDDDAFVMAGTVALLRDDPGLRFVLVIATDGEGGQIAPDVDICRDDLGALRRLADEAAWRAVGRVPDRIVWLGLPDGRLADLTPGCLTDLIADVIAEERPDVVATFGPDGFTGHPDHITVGKAACEAFHRHARVGRPGLRRLLHAGIRRERLERWNGDLAAAGLPTSGPEQLYHFRWVPDETIGIEVDTAVISDRVVAGIRARRSQWSYTTVPAAADEPLARSLRSETWAIAWPPPRPGAPMLTSVFEGLVSSS